MLSCAPLHLEGGRVDQEGMKRIPRGRDPLLGWLLAAGLLLRLAIACAPFSYLASRGPLLDDAFYSFSIARNLAAGHGPTADGIHATSGFQPLHTVLLVPFYLLFPRDPILPIHLALTLLALCGCATGWLIYRIVSRVAPRPAALFSLALWTFSPYFLFQGENDRNCPVEYLRRFQDHLRFVPRPNIRIRIQPGVGHALDLSRDKPFWNDAFAELRALAERLVGPH